MCHLHLQQCHNSVRTALKPLHCQSLFRHKKKCKGSSVHVPMPASCRKEIVSSDNHTAKLQCISKLIEDADKVLPSKDTDDISVNDDTTDKDNAAEEFIDDEERYDHQLWFLLCVKCFNYDNKCMAIHCHSIKISL